MSRSIPNSSIPHLLHPPAGPPCPTCSCPFSHPQSHFQLPPVPSAAAPSSGNNNKKMKVSPDTMASSPGTGSTGDLPGPKLPQAFSFPRPQLLEAQHFHQPQHPPSSVAPAPISTPGSPPNQLPTTAPAPPAVASSSQANAADLHSSNPAGHLESFIYKNRLQQYTQRSCIPLPEYKIVNEGSQHAPRFRSSVTVDGITYSSPTAFSNRKASEQNIAKHAMECISKKIKEERSPLVLGDTVFCKSILNEFADKMNLPKPTYNIVQPEAVVTVFVSSLVFNGATYTGDPGKNKKEAEQLAARAAILSLMGDLGFGTALSEIINSKGKLFDAFYKVKDLNYAHNSVVPVRVNAGSDFEILHTEDQVVKPNVPTPSQPINATQEVHVPAQSQPISATQEVSVPAPSEPINAIQEIYVPAPSQPISAIASVPIVSQPIGATKEAYVPTLNQLVRAIQGASVPAMSVIPEAFTRNHPSHQELRVPKQEPLSAENNPPKAFMPMSAMQQVSGHAPTQPISAIEEVSTPTPSNPISAIQQVSVSAPSQPASATASAPIASPSMGAFKEASVSIVNQPFSAFWGASVPTGNQPFSAFRAASVSAMSVAPEAYIRPHSSFQEWAAAKPETLSAGNNPPKSFVPPIQRLVILPPPPPPPTKAPAPAPPPTEAPALASAQQQSLGVVPNIGKKRHRRKNKKVNKEVQVGTE